MAALGGLPSIASCEVVAQLTRSVVSLSLVHSESAVLHF